MKTIIVDDERLARKELISLLASFDFIEVIKECANADEAKEAIEQLKPDLVFLDIQMPEKTGFELLEELDYVPQVIFVTAYDEFAIKAFEVNALDYILKPVDSQRLEKTLLKLKEENSELNREESKISNKKLTLEDQIFIKDGDKCWFVTLKDVRYFESVGNYIKIHFENNKPLILRSLNKIEERLEDKIFFRTNRKNIVNVKWVSKVDNWFSGGLKLTLKTGEEIEVSRRQAQKFKELMSL
ncbi:LytTR family DNA-binding domain-containing protein [Flavobacteriales bacterium]|nr:LytTR family DNA-binding domain-containing protein [Flavobacteriales bacterium]